MNLTAAFTLEGHSSHVNKVAFATGTNKLFSLGFSGEVYQWDPNTGKRLAGYNGHKSSVNAIAFLSEDQFITASNDGVIVRSTIGQPDNGTVIYEGKEAIQSLSGCKNKTTLLFSTPRRIIVYDTKKGTELFSTKQVARNLSVKAVLESQGQFIVGGAGARLFTHDLKDGRLLSEKDVVSLACTSYRVLNNGSALLFSYTGELMLLDEKGEVQKRFVPSKTVAHSLALFPNEETAAIAIDFGLMLVDLKTFSEQQTVKLPAKGNYAVAVSSDGAWLAVASADKKVRLWQVQ